MISIPGAKASPRIEAGVLCWYEGDTFDLEIQFALLDQDEDAVHMQESDRVTVTFLDETRKPVREFSFTELEDNRVTLVFDEAVSGTFTKGRYTYDVRYTHANKTTLVRDNRVLVQ